MIYPVNKEELQTIIRTAREEKRTLFPVSSKGPHLRGVPDLSGIPGAEIVDFSGMNRIFKIDSQSRYAWIEPGVTFGELMPLLAEQGMRLNAPFLPRAGKSVIASMLDREPPLTAKYHYDQTDPLLATEVVFGTGDDFRTGSASGPVPLSELKADKVNPWGPGTVDYFRFIMGSQGTIGFVTWATLKAEMMPQMARLKMICSDDLSLLTSLANAVIRKRVPDECIILNNVNLAAVLTDSCADSLLLAKELPAWTMLVRICGFDRYPEERISIFEKYLADAAAELGLSVLDALPGLESRTDDIDALLTSCDSSEVYWPLRQGGGLEDLCFLAPPSRTPGLVGVAGETSRRLCYPDSRIGILVQPQMQGRGFHVGLNYYYPKEDMALAAEAGALSDAAFDALFADGAFFSRPVGRRQCDAVFAVNPQSTEALRKIKGIFDPDGILSPGRLCF
jgi:hypothetical protein